MSFTRKLLLGALVIGLYVAHQDFWNWRSYEPLILGFLPAGLAYHVGYSVAAAVMMAILVRWAWPKHLEDIEPLTPSGRKDQEAAE